MYDIVTFHQAIRLNGGVVSLTIINATESEVTYFQDEGNNSWFYKFLKQTMFRIGNGYSKKNITKKKFLWSNLFFSSYDLLLSKQIK